MAGFITSKAASPAPMADFDLERYMDAWYGILMSNDLPFFTSSCVQNEVRLEADGTYTFYSRSYNLMNRMAGEMDR